MDHLPKTLLCLMNTVVEQYIEFSWTSQEQNGKMKITLTWTNVEMKRNKSKATRKRDRKRHEQYIEQKKVNENNKETEIKETNTNNIEDSSSEDDSDSTDSEMDTIQNIITPCSTPSQVNRQDENQSINTTKDIPVVDNQVCKEVITSDTIQKVVQPIKVHDNIQTECVKPNTQVSDLPKRRRRFFSKIVIKTTDGHQDTLIGKLPRTQNLIVHIISQNITEIVGPSIREWKYFMKNVNEDFKDVEETDFMDDGVRNAIQKMENFVEQRTLKNKK